MISLLLLLPSLLRNTTGSIYNVTPDDHYYPNTACHNCHNLQHYLLNTTKYFTSNTQLFFLPGLHHLHTDLIIQNIHNISLIGSTTTPDTVIQCNSSVGIVMINITNLIMKNMMISNCTKHHSTSDSTDLLIEHCYHVQLTHLKLYGIVDPNSTLGTCRRALRVVNVLGSCVFTHITSNGITIEYDEPKADSLPKSHKLLIRNYHIVLDEDVHSDTVIVIFMHQFSYKVELKICNSNFSFLRQKILLRSQFNLSKLKSSIHFTQCIIFRAQITNQNLFYLQHLYLVSCTATHHLIRFTNCKFYRNYIQVDGALINTESKLIDVEIKDCIFENGAHKVIRSYAKYTYTSIYDSFGSYDKCLDTAKVIISNTTFSSINCQQSLVEVADTLLQLNGPVVFTQITIKKSYYFGTIVPSNAIIFAHKSDILFKNYIEFSKSTLDEGAYFAFESNPLGVKENWFIIFQENTLINISNNRYRVQSLLHEMNKLYPFCYFQFTSKRGNLDSEFANGAPLNYSIIINNDSSADYLHQVMTHCSWISSSAFNTTSPYDAYKKFTETNWPLTRGRIICLCNNESNRDCFTHLLSTIYPGQLIVQKMALNKRYLDIFYSPLIKAEINQLVLPRTACKLIKVDEVGYTICSNCTATQYTIIHNKFSNYAHWCELFLTIRKSNLDNQIYYNKFYVNFYPCPAGFVQLNGVCTCDPLLNSKLLSITTCDINHQTILRPPNTWLSAITINNSHQYHISPNCALQYCLPYSSQLNFSTSNSQCQFNRSGLLCGQCQKSLSTVFGSSQCQYCSSYYLFLIIPFAIAGFMLVLLLFTLNLTVTDGDINGFILYVNIISINSHVFFPLNNSIEPSYIFVSIANLDLGIKVCFYSGMDDYAKMWLHLVFPLYLIFIATSLIIASRHSTRIQRITAHRALPVLATLFLLSYTKILTIVSSVLFYYSTITHLPSKHTTLVWAVDANVPLFGVRFTLFFVVCLLLFLILLLLSTILIFTKTLSRSRCINRFKPLIDAFQGPHKYQYYYWTGVQLVMRVTFFSLSALSKNVNLTTGCILLAITIAVQADFNPFKKKRKHYSELMFLLNLLIMYTLTFGDHEFGVKIMITVGAVQLVIIIIYHIITNVCGEVIMFTNIINTIVKWITRSHHLPQQVSFKLNNTPPDKTFNYLEYREPLVAED